MKDPIAAGGVRQEVSDLQHIAPVLLRVLFSLTRRGAENPDRARSYRAQHRLERLRDQARADFGPTGGDAA